MTRALVVDEDASNRLASAVDLSDNWLEEFGPLPDGVNRVDSGNIIYLIGATAKADARLLVIKESNDGFFSEIRRPLRIECFQRILRATLSLFFPAYVKIPLDWRVFHSGNLLSFQTNRFNTGARARAYLDTRPENTNHVFAYRICVDDRDALTRIGYDGDLFIAASLGYDVARGQRPKVPQAQLGHTTVELSETFDSNIALGIPFSTWRDAKLAMNQRRFFDAPFNGPLRVKGPAGSGKTLVLAMRFLKEIYTRLDANQAVRACFLAHSEETAQNILNYLRQIDERGLFSLDYSGTAYLEITTLHGLANQYINTDTQNVQPLSLDGSEGRILQFELLQSLVFSYSKRDLTDVVKSNCRTQFLSGLSAPEGSSIHKSFCVDLSDEFASVLETLGVRNLDDIGNRYLKARPSDRGLAQNQAEKLVVLELYRRFRHSLSQMNVVSLDQFTADFLAFLNSFRWDSLRRDRGFDFVFADELHLFNSQERRVLGFLLRDTEPPRRVAVAYDPRQSPRNSFFPEAVTKRDTIWTEAQLESETRPFELEDVFRYTPQILTFLSRLNQQFPATDFAEDWALSFGRSQIADGPMPVAFEEATQLVMSEAVIARAKSLMRRARAGEQVAVLCLDHDRFIQYQSASRFQDDFVIVGGRDQLGSVARFHKRAVLSVPEYVAGLQFTSVLLVDANALLVAELGGAVNGLHRFISSVYLGASRAKQILEIYADLSSGGFAEPIRDAIKQGAVVLG